MRFFRSVAFCLLASAEAAYCQSGGRFEEAKRTGMALFEGEHFEKSAGRLEEVWEQDKSDATVGEYLAMAYLNVEDRSSLKGNEKLAFDIIDKLTGANQRVSFLVLHSHEKIGWLQGSELNRYCRGKLSLSNGKLVYVGTKGEPKSLHSFEQGAEGVKSITLNEDDRRGTFQLKTASGGYYFATRNRNKNEARFLVALVKKTLGTK